MRHRPAATRRSRRRRPPPTSRSRSVSGIASQRQIGRTRRRRERQQQRRPAWRAPRPGRAPPRRRRCVSRWPRILAKHARRIPRSMRRRAELIPDRGKGRAQIAQQVRQHLADRLRLLGEHRRDSGDSRSTARRSVSADARSARRPGRRRSRVVAPIQVVRSRPGPATRHRVDTRPRRARARAA